MQIVIDISEKDYETMQHNVAIGKPICSLSEDIMVSKVVNGTPLPKGHGDLIDRRELKKDVYTTTEWNGDVHRIIYEASVDDAPTIIPADTESEE